MSLNKITKHNLIYYLRSWYPDAIQEYKFLANRKFRFDFYIPSLKVGIEYEGVFGKGKSRHTQPVSYDKDCEKYNLAQLAGYRVLRYTAISLDRIKPELDFLKDNQYNKD